MDTKTIVIGASAIVGIVTIAGGGVYYSPYLTLNRMRNATENQNIDALAQEINFPELRASIKESVKAQVLKQIAGAESGTSAGKLSLPKITPEQVEKMVNLIFDKYGLIDVLINNAAITKDGIFRTMKPTDWDEVITTNLISVFNCSRFIIF